MFISGDWQGSLLMDNHINNAQKYRRA